MFVNDVFCGFLFLVVFFAFLVFVNDVFCVVCAEGFLKGFFGCFFDGF